MDGKSYLLEIALRADFALVQAFLADYLGNLSYALTARNFNPVIAMAADTVIASADNIVPVGVISPDHVVTPAPVVDYLDRQFVRPTWNRRRSSRAGSPESFHRACLSISASEFRRWSQTMCRRACMFSSSPRTG